ncbi:hypothetical protein P7C73_g81, partial [Tremellales sp. Uapishka_1]
MPEGSQGPAAHTGWTPGAGEWEGLLNFDMGETDESPFMSMQSPYQDSASSSEPMSLSRSHLQCNSTPSAHEAASSSNSPFGMRSPRRFLSPGRIARSATDLAWKTILGSQVEVEGVGQVSVTKVLGEVWKRGGGDVVTSQCLWPGIIMALSYSDGERQSHPTAHASLSLQTLYNLTLRHWEPSIFCGLLSSYSGSAAPAQEPTPSYMDNDFTQWMDMDTGSGADWSLFAGNTTVGTGVAPGAMPFESDSRRASVIKSDIEQSRGIDEILASMEEGQEEDQRAQSTMSFQLPTPPTDTSGSPPSVQTDLRKPITAISPVSMTSPFVTPNSFPARQPPPTHCSIPTKPFVPPPPMCMFFNPSFKDLQKGKVGIWKGDLNVRGRGGGRFSVLIVGEESNGHMWKSQEWPESITYPAEGLPVESSTASMIPVANLAREGYMPIAMGMVLCDDPKISEYVAMVQGFHAEGVAFHLPTLSKLPIVFLPAKFDSNDNLQRLGIAFMSKSPLPPSNPTAKAKEETKKKKRRQSSVASSGKSGMLGNQLRGQTSGGHSRVQSTTTGLTQQAETESKEAEKGR